MKYFIMDTFRLTNYDVFYPTLKKIKLYHEPKGLSKNQPDLHNSFKPRPNHSETEKKKIFRRVFKSAVTFINNLLNS